MNYSESNKFSENAAADLSQLINSLNVGVWEFDVNTKVVKWSAGFYNLLGYDANDIPCTNDFFLNNLIYHGDRDLFLKDITDPKKSVSTTQIRLLTKNTGYKWFENTSKNIVTESGPKQIGSIINIHAYKILQLKTSNTETLCAGTNKVAAAYGWEIDIIKNKLSLSPEIFQLYELDQQVPLSIEEAISFFEPSYRKVLSEAIDNCIHLSHPFNLELLFRSARNNQFWVRAKGMPVINDYGDCTTIKGVFQNIDSSKRKELELNKSAGFLTDQNKRLQNFAYIVSHNLRSHTGNLQFMISLFDETDPGEEKEEIFAHIRSISESLNITIEHLTEIVKIHDEIGQEKKPVDLETMFNNALSALNTNIMDCEAMIDSDFSECKEIDYVPAYMDSIFQNLLTNSIKYRHPERQPAIKCRTRRVNGNVYLHFEDNGIGIDMLRYKDKVFGLYNTFHQNHDSKGIGLFMTKNQIEALGGSIDLESEVNVGTKFTIKLV